MVLVKAENLTKEFVENVKVLDDVSLEINKGDFVSILGPSGSGKSTLLTILAGIDKPTSGTVYLDGVNLSNVTEKELAILRRTKLGYVFQFFNLVPYMTVKENIMLPLILNGKITKEMEANVDALMKDLGIKLYANRLPSKLSGGEQQRVAIARGMIFKPEILFLDEPTGNLDSKTGHEIMLLLHKINKEHKTTIVQVTHNKENAQFSSKLIYIKDGKLVSEIDDATVEAEITMPDAEEPNLKNEGETSAKNNVMQDDLKDDNENSLPQDKEKENIEDSI